MGRLSIVLLLGLTACALDPLERGALTVTTSVNRSDVSESNPGIVQVSAHNMSGVPVSLGMGSSSCALSLWVLTEAGQRHPVAGRICTMDLVRDREVLPGDRRTESFEFDGSVAVDGVVRRLEPNTYRLIGTAADKGESPAVEVRVVAD
ncbi:MAG: hypothetical protein JJ896_01260 [Rhodothermales bacterium]|nr:hypothetical protein [Rhodothermales bacterium]MBO6778256.1 hypothetical protein [Rhodothermales bacterium]